LNETFATQQAHKPPVQLALLKLYSIVLVTVVVLALEMEMEQSKDTSMLKWTACQWSLPCGATFCNVSCDAKAHDIEQTCLFVLYSALCFIVLRIASPL